MYLTPSAQNPATTYCSSLRAATIAIAIAPYIATVDQPGSVKPNVEGFTIVA